MKILIIDSHKSSDDSPQQNLYWKNAKILADYLEADLIWSYPTVNNNIVNNYDVIIYNHASKYSFIDDEWVTQNPNAKLFYITNEYNLGEPVQLWGAAKAGRHYDVIANHPQKVSKVVNKYVNNWHHVNLNALVYKPFVHEYNDYFWDEEKKNCVYFGSFRKGRIPSYKKYLKDEIVLSTHVSNISKFRDIGCNPHIGKRIDWPETGTGLDMYKFSLYIEDEITHTNYNCLANRFYEALNHNVIAIFDSECRENVKISGYDVPERLFVSSYDEAIELMNSLEQSFIDETLVNWHKKAVEEREEVLNQIKDIIMGEN